MNSLPPACGQAPALRPYQAEAVERIEPEIAAGRRTLLVATTGALSAEIAADVASRAQVRALCRKGNRLVAELLGELGAERAIMTLIEEKLDCYIALDDRALDIAGRRELAPAPVRAVPP